jgi:hypothetical protein
MTLTFLLTDIEGSLEARPNNLPVQLTSFVGRDSELAELRQQLSAHRLVTLTGIGGGR